MRTPQPLGAATQVLPGVWTLPTGFWFLGLLKFVNRGILFRTAEGLVLVNGVEPTAAIRKAIASVEAESGQTLVAVVSPGDYHNVYLARYHELYPKVRIFVPEGRIRTLSHMRTVQHSDRFFEMSHEDPAAALGALADDFLVHSFKGVVGPSSIFNGIVGALRTPRRELMMLHKPTGTLINADLLWYTSEPQGLERGNFKPGVIQFHFWKGRMISDARAARESADTILSWEIERMIPMHGHKDDIVDPSDSPTPKEQIRTAFTFLDPLVAKM